ncbi:MAG TPA: VWA domain-containing protein [Candidatus Mcinerneyibacteriales bacterium]|nr:VWA domain-containing protein [Candidatus Mcinerneyibacteriales bacterium]
MGKKSVDIAFVLDRSGSMSSIKEETIRQFNNYLEKQKSGKEKVFWSMALFNEEYDLLFDRALLDEIPELNEDNYQPGGCTALLDAMGETIRHMEKRQKRAGIQNVILCILTDGLENASREYSLERIRLLIKEKRQKGWEFVFLGANQDAIATAGSMGMNRRYAHDFQASDKGIHCCMLSAEHSLDEIASLMLSRDE